MIKKQISRLIAFLAFAFIISSCADNTGTGSQTEAAESDTAKEDHEEEGTVSLTNAQMEAIGIQFGTIEQKLLTNSIKANGILTVPNQNKAFVTPLHAGVVKSLQAQPGSYVKRGQVIATLVNPNLLQVQQELQQVNVQIRLAETELKRQEELVKGNAAPLKRMQEAAANLAGLRTRRTGLESQLGSVGASKNFSSALVVRAPISGTISKVMAQLGSNVDVSAPIAEVVDNSLLHLDLYVYEKDLPKLKTGQDIHFTITNNAGKEYDARIFSIGTAFENDSKTVQVHARVIGDKTGLIDGMNVTANVSLEQARVSAIPAEAIVNQQGTDYIFVVWERTAASTRFERIPVAKGTTDVGYSEVTLLKEVPASAQIVVKGAYFVMAKQTNSGEHGH